MKCSIRFGPSSIALLVLEQQEFEVGSLLRINIAYCLWMKNSMFNISRSTLSKDPVFGMGLDILANFRLSGKYLQLEPQGIKYSDLIEELAPKIMSSRFLKSTFGLTQTTKSISRSMKYRRF